MAVCCPPSSLTYSELKLMSDAFAARLQRGGFSPGSTACIVQGRSCKAIVSMLGVLKAGGCYVPLEPGLPEERLRAIVEDSGAGAVITDEGIDWREDSRRGPEGLAYIIYTSGSTGRPKGVEISRRALSAFTEAISGVLGISSADRISCHSSFSFDASVEDIYPVLCAGGTLYIVPEELRRDPSSLAEFLLKHRITGGNYTTRFGILLLEQCELPGLRYMVLGGEKMSSYPSRGRRMRLFNTYGPTEFTVDATWYEMDPSRRYDDIPIGRPLPGVEAAVVDCGMHPVPDGVPGELCLLGEQMAEGYRGLPERPPRRSAAGCTAPGILSCAATAFCISSAGATPR